MSYTVEKRKQTILSGTAIEKIKEELAEAYISSFIQLQQNLLQTYDLDDFYSGDSEDVAKICVEYSALLFQLSIFILSATPLSKNDFADLYNHIYKAHLVCTEKHTRSFPSFPMQKALNSPMRAILTVQRLITLT